MPFHHLDLSPVSLSLDLGVGHIASLRIREGGRNLAPLHRAPWADDPEDGFPEGTAPNVVRLSGDFLCAPFGLNDIETAPPHGWPANSAWEHTANHRQGDRLTASFRLEKRVMGARVEKRLSLREGHPFVYQEHIFSGGHGAVSMAHHTMVHMRDGGQLAFSPKSVALTPPDALEPDPARGRSILQYPATTDDLGAFPMASGAEADLAQYPPGRDHEDFVTLVDSPSDGLGWSVVSRTAERDRILVLKDPATFPVTMLWMSNGGRDYPPWSSRHAGVLGIEDGRASPLGHADSIRDNGLTRQGVATSFELGEGLIVSVRQVIGACAVAPGEGGVREVEVGAEELILHLDRGMTRRLPFWSDFLAT